MRLPWPEKMNLRVVVMWAGVLALVQVLMGTSFGFSILVFFFIVFWAAAFNAGGGMNRIPGAYVLFLGLETLIVSQVMKVILLQPADSNLRNPILSAGIYATGMLVVLLCVVFARNFGAKRALQANARDESRMLELSITCTVIGVVCSLGVAFFGIDPNTGNVPNGTIWSALNQATLFMPLGILLGVRFSVFASNGRRSLAWFSLAPMLVEFFIGAVNTSKEGMVTPVVTYVVACAAARYNFKKKEMAALIAFSIFAWFVIFPFAQIARGTTRIGNTAMKAQMVREFLEENNILDLNREYDEISRIQEEKIENRNGGISYYGKDEKFIERITIFETDDAIIDYTERNGVFGLTPISNTLQNLLPRFLNPDKSLLNLTNAMGRAVEIIGPEDYSTSIAFGLFGSSYYMYGWLGVTVLMAAMVFLYFWALDSLFGDVRQNAWAIVIILFSVHEAPEAVAVALIAATWQQVVYTVPTFAIIRFISPFVGTIFGSVGWDALIRQARRSHSGSSMPLAEPPVAAA